MIFFFLLTAFAGPGYDMVIYNPVYGIVVVVVVPAIEVMAE